MSSDEPFLPFARPTISEEAIAEVADCLRSGWITTGPRTAAFEMDMKTYFDAPHALAFSSATAGLYVALKAIGLQPGDEVITTAMTFAATLNVIVLAGGIPIMVDVDPRNYNICVEDIESKITPRTKAIMPVHFAGFPVDLDPIYALAKQHNLRVIEDSAHAIGNHYKGRKLGSFGDIQVFSFHPNKNMTTGEGGGLVTRDDDVANAAERQRFHGMDRMAWNRFSKAGSQHYEIVEPAHKFNMMDIQSALGLHQLRAVDGFNEKRTQLAGQYFEALKDFEPLLLPQFPTKYDFTHAWHLFSPRVNEKVTSLSRDEVMQALKEENIGTGLHYRAPHLYPYYRKTFGYKPGDCPKAEAVGESIFSLPLFPTLTQNEFDRVICALKKVFKNA